MGKQMGQVIVTLTVTNRIDQVLAQRGFISSEAVRSYTLDNVFVDAIATLFSNAQKLYISNLSLRQANLYLHSAMKDLRLTQQV
ncbi:hypothetical protein [Nostoc sp. WHI]|uniref:hypothetical protein n=1 Tax=Nostoc sp. WHI TaxID=2650611 RepID=UPI001E5925F3|nr:hypothetical protein [Nostoc sp. WHI]